jgi:hypothetical protein
MQIPNPSGPYLFKQKLVEHMLFEPLSEPLYIGKTTLPYFKIDCFKHLVTFMLISFFS